MPDYLAQIKAGIRPLIIHSVRSFSWFGLRYRRPSRVLKSFTSETLKELLVSDLQRILYENFYCVGFPAFLAGGDVRPTGNLIEQRRLAHLLSQANTGTGFWEPGWTIQKILDGELFASRKGFTLRVRQEETDFSERAAPHTGDTVSLRCAKDLPRVSPGFYMALGNRALEENADRTAIVRLYINVTPAGAIGLMRMLTDALNAEGIAFRFKILTDLARFSRCDAGVLYIQQRDYPAVRRILLKALPHSACWLREGTPALTKTLMPGLGLAESPKSQESFGLDRCRHVAESLVRAFERSRSSPQDRFQAVIEHLAESGIDPHHPYLNLGSSDLYSEIEFTHNRILNLRRFDPLAVAVSIGQAILDQAIWHGDQCGWIGAAPLDNSIGRGRYAALGPHLYSGTSGIALFLAELFAATRNEEFGRTAEGAMKHAIQKARSSRTGRTIGLFEGDLGVAVAAARVGTILGNSGLVQAGRVLIRSTRHGSRNDEEFDLISGKAGAIFGYILLARLWHDPQLIDRAAFLGRKLLHSARRKDGGCSWGPPDSLHLTGFSHGTAGAAYALIELYRATGDERYILAAQDAFNYEEQWYDPDVGNWRDLRDVRVTAALRAFSVCFWCHGAPGIALSRLRALEVLAEDNRASDTNDAFHALDTTRQMVEAALYSGASNFSLCHGLAGNAEILMEGSRVLGETFAIGEKLAWRVARVGADRHADHSDQWPCGLGTATTPGLMCGLAGIGYFYMRLHNPSVPSVLMPRPEFW